jgi:hypothetical protein
MAYAGFLIKVGNYTIPTEYIQFKTYKTKLSVVDVDSYRDADVKLHRFASEHTLNKVEFNTIYLTDDKMDALMSNIRENYTVAKERRMIATVFSPELGDYMTQDVYLADPEYTIYNVVGNRILYMPTRLAFTAY